MKEYYFKEGCYIEEWSNSPQQPDCSVAHVRVNAGETTKLHSLKDTTERYVILQGSALVTVGDQQWAVSEKDVVTIPANTAQCIQNTQATDLLFLAICTPRFELDNYTELADHTGTG